MIWLLVLIFAFVGNSPVIRGQISIADLNGDETAESPNDDPAQIQNASYIEEQTKLQQHIFGGYNRQIRPVRNQSKPTVVSLHIHVMHYSVDQLKQSLKIHGHIYMTWFDELAAWDPTEFSNLRTTMVNQWDLWQPELKIANSVSGVNQYFEISRRSHATLTSISPDASKVEIYPTFTTTVGCNFDYSAYPFDEQECAARFYTTPHMQQVELTIYYQLKPSVMLAWGDSVNKRHISDWELLDTEANITYYRDRLYNNTKPSTPEEAGETWSILVCKMIMRRNTVYYWFTMVMPALAAALFNLLSFIVFRTSTALVIVGFSFVVQTVLIQSELTEIPLSVLKTPNIVKYTSALHFLTLIAVAAHLIIHFLAERKVAIPQKLQLLAKPIFTKLNSEKPTADRICRFAVFASFLLISMLLLPLLFI